MQLLLLLNQKFETQWNSITCERGAKVSEPIPDDGDDSTRCIVISRAIIPGVIIVGLIYRTDHQET